MNVWMMLLKYSTLTAASQFKQSLFSLSRGNFMPSE